MMVSPFTLLLLKCTALATQCSHKAAFYYHKPISIGLISEVFLKGTGTPDDFVAYLASLVGEFTDYPTCFISYASKDQAFAEQLHADLQSKGVRCWLVPEDMKIGDPTSPRIEELIRLSDKLVLVLSEYSMASSWIAHEVERALICDGAVIKIRLFVTV